MTESAYSESAALEKIQEARRLTDRVRDLLDNQRQSRSCPRMTGM